MKAQAFPVRARSALHSTAVVVVTVVAAQCGREREPERSTLPATRLAEGAHVSVTRPSVIAYFVIPSGAVDTLPDLAVEADDWNVAMATLRDSLEASGIDLALVTDSSVRVSIRGRPDTTLSLGTFKTSGYVFVRPDGGRCVRTGGADPESVKVTARAFVTTGGCT